MDSDDQSLIKKVLEGDNSSFERLVEKYQPRVFATARKYARRESEVADIVQEVFIKSYRKLSSYRGDAPYEHWLMRLAVRTCYDSLRSHQRNRETHFTDIGDEDLNLLDRFVADPSPSTDAADAAKALVHRLFEQLTPKARLVLTLLEIEGRSVKEIAKITGWSESLVKVRAFRARNEMRKCLQRINQDQYL